MQASQRSSVRQHRPSTLQRPARCSTRLRAAAGSGAAVERRPSEPAAVAAFEAAHPATLEGCLAVLEQAAVAKSVPPEVWRAAPWLPSCAPLWRRHATACRPAACTRRPPPAAPHPPSNRSLDKRLIPTPAPPCVPTAMLPPSTPPRAPPLPPLPPQIVEGALAWLEGASVPGGAAGVDGSWRLVFSTSTAQRFFQARARARPSCGAQPRSPAGGGRAPAYPHAAPPGRAPFNHLDSPPAPSPPPVHSPHPPSILQPP